MKRSILLSVVAVTLMTGCSTLQGVKSDISSGYQSVAGVFERTLDPVKEEKKKLPVYDGSCPPVSIRPDLRTLVEFADPAKTVDAAKVSEATITGVKNTCRVEKDAIVMQIDMSVAGKTGPKARVKSGDKPSFAYPYFVAVVDENGMVLSKEIFAASVPYGASQNETVQTETIFQNMPVPDSGAGTSYEVIVGFQLTADQLAYNQKAGL